MTINWVSGTQVPFDNMVFVSCLQIKLPKLTRTGQDVGPVHLARRVRPVRLVIRWKANLSVELRSDIDCIHLSTLALQGQG